MIRTLLCIALLACCRTASAPPLQERPTPGRVLITHPDGTTEQEPPYFGDGECAVCEQVFRVLAVCDDCRTRISEARQ